MIIKYILKSLSQIYKFKGLSPLLRIIVYVYTTRIENLKFLVELNTFKLTITATNFTKL